MEIESNSIESPPQPPPMSFQSTNESRSRSRQPTQMPPSPPSRLLDEEVLITNKNPETRVASIPEEMELSETQPTVDLSCSDLRMCGFEHIYTPHMGQTGLHLIAGDITKFPGDAIVNAANVTLEPGGGVDRAIHIAGGRVLKNERMAIPPRDGIRCQTGASVITSAGDLPCRFCIHAVGPEFKNCKPEHLNEAYNKLRTAYQSAIDLAEQNQLTSIAFPIISGGAFIGNQSLNAVIQFGIESILSKLPMSHVKEIYLVGFDTAVQFFMRSYISSPIQSMSLENKSTQKRKRSQTPFLSITASGREHKRNRNDERSATQFSLADIKGEKNCLLYRSFYLCGTFHSPSAQEWENLIRNFGGKLHNKLSPLTQNILVGENPPELTIKKAQSSKRISILTLQDFVDMLTSLPPRKLPIRKPKRKKNTRRAKGKKITYSKQNRSKFKTQEEFENFIRSNTIYQHGHLPPQLIEELIDFLKEEFADKSASESSRHHNNRSEILYGDTDLYPQMCLQFGFLGPLKARNFDRLIVETGEHLLRTLTEIPKEFAYNLALANAYDTPNKYMPLHQDDETDHDSQVVLLNLQSSRNFIITSEKTNPRFSHRIKLNPGDVLYTNAAFNKHVWHGREKGAPHSGPSFSITFRKYIPPLNEERRN